VRSQRNSERRGPGRRLTDRQATILEHVAQGLENKEIGQRLGISEQAVKEHISVLLRRLAVHNRAALADAAATLRFVGNVDVAPEWLGLLFLRAPMLVALLEGPEHRFVAVNEAYRLAAGPRDLIGRTFRESFPDLDEAGILPLLDESFRTGEPRLAPEASARWYRSLDGAPEPGFLTTLVQPMHREDGAVGGTVFFGIDVTDEVLARRRADQIELEQLALLDLLTVGVIVFDAQLNVVKANARARELITIPAGARLDAETAAAYGLRDAVDGRPIPYEDTPARRALRGERSDPLVFRIRDPRTRQDRLLRISAVPIRDRDGTVRGCVSTFGEA